MHNKSFFQGLGLGIVIASVIFLILYSTRAKNENVLNENSEAVQTETQSTSSIMDLPEKNEPETESTVEIGTLGELETIDTQDLTISEKALAFTEDEDDVVRLKIEEGEIAASVYRKLYELGVTEDETGFAEYIRRNNYSTRKIASGEYKIKKGASYKEIYEMIKAD